MTNKLTHHTVALISAVYKNNIYDDSWRAVYKYGCISCGDNSRCPYARFRLGDSRVCLGRISHDRVNRMNIYCDAEDPTHTEKFVAFINGKLFD